MDNEKTPEYPLQNISNAILDFLRNGYPTKNFWVKEKLNDDFPVAEVYQKGPGMLQIFSKRIARVMYRGEIGSCVTSFVKSYSKKIGQGTLSRIVDDQIEKEMEKALPKRN